MAAPRRMLSAPLYKVQKKLRAPAAPPMPPTEADHAARTDEETEAAWEAYLIPGEDHVLRNKLGRSADEPYGITDKDELIRLEERFTAFRMIELQQRPIQGDFSLRHMRAIHSHLFQDVYDWAGEPRNVDMAKNGHTHMAYFQIERLWGKVSDYVERHNRFQDVTDPNEFSDKLAFVWGRVNVIHAFREGNTRSQVLFFDQLCSQAGFELDVARLAPEHPDSVRDDFVAARYYHQDNSFDHAPLAAVLSKIVRPPAQTLEQRLERASAPRADHEHWAPRTADPAKTAQKPSSLDSSPDEYENPDKMRTAHRRIGTQESTDMAIDPSKEPARSSFDPQDNLRERQQSIRATNRIREAQERFGSTPHMSAAVDWPGNTHTAAMVKREAEQAKLSRSERLPHDPIPRRPGARVVPSSRDSDAPVPMPVASEPDLDASFWDDQDDRFPTAEEVKQWEADFDPKDPSGDIAREAARKAAGRPVVYPTPAPTPGRGKHRAPIFEDTSAASKDDDYGPSL